MLVSRPRLCTDYDLLCECVCGQVLFRGVGRYEERSSRACGELSGGEMMENDAAATSFFFASQGLKPGHHKGCKLKGTRCHFMKSNNVIGGQMYFCFRACIVLV